MKIYILLLIFSSLNYLFLLSELISPFKVIRFDKFIDDDGNNRMILI